MILNLDSGKYHGLSPDGGRMLEVMETAPSVRAAAETLAVEYDQPLETIENDIADFCNDLLERNLIELSPAA